jgi:tetratricopeptide (TPR) repeat protein
MLGLAVVVGACAEDPRVLEERTKAEAAEARPWEPAQVLLDSAVAKLKAGGVRAIEPQVAELENALAKAPEAIAKGRSAPARVLLADGLHEVMGAALAAGVPLKLPDAPAPSPQSQMSSALPPQQGPAVTVLASPYPPISMILGSYYVEMRRPNDALRVLEAGLALPPAVPGVPRSMVPALSVERANALGLAGRWQDALVAWERALKLPELSDPVKARILRGRGVALIELKRLNEAEQTFRSALALEPGNANAQNELAYIAALRAGRPAVKPDIRTGAPPTQP